MTTKMLDARNRGKDELRLLFFNKLERFLPLDYVDCTGFAPEAYTVAFLRDVKHLGAESRTDKLSVGCIRDRLKHLRNCRTVLSVKVGVDLVEEVERRRITGLDSKNQRKGTKTYEFATLVNRSLH